MVAGKNGHGKFVAGKFDRKNSLFVALRLNCSYKNKKRNNELILTQNKILPID